MTRKNNGASQDARTIVTVLLLLFAWPVGLIVMWVWSKWPTWLQFIITLLSILLIIIGIVTVIAAVNISNTDSDSTTPLLENTLIKTCNTCLDAHGGDTASCQTECRSFLMPTTDPYQE